MKTPREILLERHKAAGRELDAIRKSAIETMGPVKPAEDQERNEPPIWFRIARILWRELFAPCRGAWAGLAAVWLVIITLQSDPTAQTAPTDAGKSASSSMVTLAMFQERRKVIAQLLDTSNVSVAPASQAGPRSDYKAPVVTG